MTARRISGNADAAARWSVFDAASVTFNLLVTEPDPVGIDGNAFEELPDRHISLDELAAMLGRRRCSRETRDAVWRHLVARSRDTGGTWTVACVGVALPGLIRLSSALCRSFEGDWDDIHSAVLTGFLTALADIDLARPWVLDRLRSAARDAGKKAVRDAAKSPIPVEDGFESHPPPRLADHADFVLADAVADGVLTTDQAHIIGETRIGGLSLREFAEQSGRGYATCRWVRLRAERALIAYIAARADGVAPTADDPHRPQKRPRTRQRARSRSQGVSRPPRRAGREISRRDVTKPGSRFQLRSAGDLRPHRRSSPPGRS